MQEDNKKINSLKNDDLNLKTKNIYKNKNNL